jgi:NitT/TauT family transport system substrate-binding protein
VRAQTLTPIKVGSSPGWTLSEGYVAAAKGFFSAAGLDATVVSSTNGGAMTAAVVGGALDIAVTNTGSVADAHAHGVPVALFAPSTMAVAGSPNTTIRVLRDSPIRTAHDAIGKTIAVATLHDLQQAALMEWLAKNGGDVKATNYVEVPPASMLAALKSGRIDACVMSELYSAVARNDTRVLGRPYEALGREIMTAGWVARRDWLSANPVTARKCFNALGATARWITGHQSEMYDVLQSVAGIDIGTLREMGHLYLGERLDVRQIQPIIDAVAKYGFLPQAFPAADMIAMV